MAKYIILQARTKLSLACGTPIEHGGDNSISSNAFKYPLVWWTEPRWAHGRALMLAGRRVWT